MSETEINKAPQENKKKKFTFKMPSAIVILIGILFALVVLSWILAWTTGDVTTDAEGNITEGVGAMGIFGVGVAMAHGFMAGSDLIFYLFVLGAVIELMLVSGSLENGISGLVKGFNGKELLLIPILVVLFSAGGAIYGMSEETIALFVIIVPALSLAGFDAIVGMMVILGGTATGCAMSIVNPFNLGAATGAINDVEGIIYQQGVTLIITIVWWVILTSITSMFVTGYAWWVKKDPSKSLNKEKKEECNEWLAGFTKNSNKASGATTRQKWSLGIFITSFTLMILLFVPWADLVGLEYSTGNNDPIFGLIAPLGTWYFGELSMLFILTGAIIALILGMGATKTSKAAWAGAKEMFSVAIVIGIARGIPYILETTGMQNFLVGGMIQAMGEISPIAFLYISFFILLLLSTVITSTSGLAGATMGLFASAVLAFTSSGSEKWAGIDPATYMGAIVIAYMMAIGVMNFFIPTNPIVMASMDQSRVAYGDGVKVMAPIAGVMFLITVALILPSTMLLWA